MATSLGLRNQAAALAMAALLACAPVAMRGDLARVTQHSGFDDAALGRVLDDDFEAVAGTEVKRLLDQPLDADAAVRVALLNNRELRARLLELGVARGMLIEARTVANPHFEVELLPERNSDIEIGIEYEITSVILAPMRARAAAAELEAARHEVASDVVSLAQRVRVAFFALQAGHQQLAIAQQALDAFAAGHEAAQALLAAGNIAPLDAAAQVVSYERARVIVAQLELELTNRRERVQTLLGLHGAALDWRPVEQLEPAPTQLPDDTNLETRAIAANLRLAATHSRIEAARRRVELARVDGWMPDIELDVHALHAGGEPSTAPGEPWGIGGGIAIEIPLFDRGRGAIQARRSELAALAQRREGVGIDVRSAARVLRSHLQSAHGRARHFQEVILPAQRSVTEHTLLQYNAMAVGIFAVLQARRDELELELTYVDTLREYWSADATLQAMLAGSVVEGIDDAAPPRLGAGPQAQGGH